MPKDILDGIVQTKPRQIGLGVHHFVQLSESGLLEEVDDEKFDSVELIAPTGSAVPASTEVIYRKKCRNLQGCINVYAQTESGMCTASFSVGKLGMVMPKVKVKVG